MAADQQTAGPKAGQVLAVLGPLKVGQFQIGPVMQTLAFGTGTRRQTLPGGRVEVACDLCCGAGDSGLADPGVELAAGAHAEHVALARPAKRHLELANAVDAVGRHPGDPGTGRRSAFDRARLARRFMASMTSKIEKTRKSRFRLARL